MRSVYGKECATHPELAGRRYLPSNTCIECQRELNREGNKRRKLAQAARDQRLAKCEALLRKMLENGEWYGSATEWDTQTVYGTDIKAEIIEVLNHEI